MYIGLAGENVDNKGKLIAIRYLAILLMIIGIINSRKDISSGMIIFILIFIINNQLRFFSIERNTIKIASFVIELAMIVFAYKWMGGYPFAYLALAAIDSNIMFRNPTTLIGNGLIISEVIIFSLKSGIEMRLVNIGTVIIVTAVLYLSNEEKDKKLQAQELYDRLKISEEKLKKAYKDLEVYAGSIEEITLLRERNRISREIHDSVGHSLSTIAIQLGAIEKIVERDSDSAKELTKALRNYTQNCLKDVRGAVREIKPKDFEAYEGILIIEELIKNFKKLTGVDVRLSFTKEKWPLNSDQAFVIYRIIQEFLANSVRHGKATVVHIMMAFSEYKLTITMKDNGEGAEKLKEGIGLKSIRERIHEIGGTFEYNTKIGEGFLAKIEIDRAEKLKIYDRGDKSGEN
jgi:signal transduction histidine kinase